MLAKVLVGLFAVAAIGVGGYYVFTEPDECGHTCPSTQVVKPSCCSELDTTVSTTSSCCSNPSREASFTVGVQPPYTEPETLTIEPREVGAQ